MEISQIKEHLMVHAKGPGSMNDAPGVHIGTVDKVEGEFIKLTQSDSPDQQHRWIPIDWVESVDDKAVYLNKTEAEVRAGILYESPQMSSQQSPQVDPVSGAGVD
ncbi:MAG: DUF2171 domain-containing protein [Synechococcales cyanobacterium C42_A2020_086]|jgi:hypothetical protein|nr:DUF2171 domain-containing protein [Synechococcales cyanobacterium M58_A2018_015]MBF2073877.1 DUF2171 domain-containing protein [Synechococcales cyanobacterium C42_A2020_086]